VFRHNSQPDRGPPLRVLYVDDNQDVAESSVELLRIFGFESRACHDGASAILEATTFLPSVCLIDLNMPGMYGDEVAIRLRKEINGFPLVLVAVTAMSGDQDCRRIKDAGFDMHFIKPVDPHQLLLLVDTLWRAWQQWVNITEPSSEQT
jgi:two-component system OmpR family response regulator